MAQADGYVLIDTRMNTTGFDKGIAGMKKGLSGIGSGVVNMKKGFDGIGSSLGKLAKVMAGVFAVKGIASFGKEAIELGSDLQEVQNVVDVTFTTMGEKVNEFARNAAQTAGLSETMTKRYVGTFGAMSKSFGFTEDAAYDMATSLTQLSGDVASFYNITQDEAYVKLKSVFTGETETLKDLGVVMTQNALDAYAMANGFGKTTQQMTEQEKVALRYQFVMQQLSAASGDFVRTTDSWANQTRILKLQFDSLKATIGQGLINIFTPVLKVINTLLGKLQTLANAFKAFTELITGKKATGGSSGATAGYVGNTDDLSSATQGAQDYADATEDVADATKKAEKENKKYLSGLDEIHRFTEDEKEISVPSVSGGGGKTSPSTSLASGGGMDVDYGNLAKGETVLDEFSDKMMELIDLIHNHDWEGLGEFIADQINSIMEKIRRAISWSKVGPKITEFINAFTTTFNSLVDNIDWDLMGRTIGEGINTIVNTLYLLITSIDWINLGAKFAEGINGIVTTVDWEKLGNLLGEKFMMLPRILYGFVTNLDFSAIGVALGEALNGIVESIDLGLIGEFLGKALTGIFDFIIEFAKTFDWIALGDNIADGINKFFENFDMKKFGEAATEIILGLLDMLIEVIEETDWSLVMQSVIDFLTGVDWGAILEKLGTAAVTIIVALVQALMKTIKETDWSAVMQSVIDFLVVVDWRNILSKLLIAAGEIIAGLVEGLIKKIQEIKWSDIWNRILETFKKFFGINSKSTVMYQMGKYMMEGLFNGLDSLREKVVEIFEKLKTKLKEKLENIKKAFKEAFSGLTNFVKTPINAVISAFNGIISVINGLISKINSIRFRIDIPSWIPGIGGSWFGFNGFNIPQIGRIPLLAQGAVIPPNAPFAAVLGDQKSGTNIETPEALLRKVVREETGRNQQKGNGQYVFTAQINRRTLFEEVIQEAALYQSIYGRNPFELG